MGDLVTTGCIYLLTSPSGKKYVGQTWNYERRMWQHSQPGTQQPAIRRAVEKYGWENIQRKVLADGIDNQEDLDKLEIQYITEYGTLAPDGYNLKGGGSYGKHIEATKQLISKTRRERGLTWSRYMTTESIEKAVQTRRRKYEKDPAYREHVDNFIYSNKGMKFSTETKARMSEAARKSWTPQRKVAASMQDYRKSPKYRAKLSAALRGHKVSPETRAKLRQANLGKRYSKEVNAKKGRKSPRNHGKRQIDLSV